VPIIVTGGTPLYYKALFEGLFEGPAASEEFRRSLDVLSEVELHERLKQVDPAAAERLHVNDRRRVLRAIEVFELSGKPLSEQQQQWGSEHRHAAAWFGLVWDKDALNRRINARVKQMITAGWVEETKALLDRYGALSKTAGEATGYAELIAHVQGKMTLDDAIEQIKIATRQLGRRQVKWFRRWSQVTWLDAGALSLDEQVQRVIGFN
jgi:tRNA dimethylallyltransferase